MDDKYIELIPEINSLLKTNPKSIVENKYLRTFNANGDGSVFPNRGFSGWNDMISV